MGFLGGGSNNEDTSGGSGDHRTASNKKKGSVLDFSFAYQVGKAVAQNIKKGFEKAKKRKANTALLGTSDYQGDVDGRKSRVQPKPDDRTGEGNIQIGSASKDNLQKTAVENAPDGPTIGEMAQIEETEAERLARIKRRGRKSTKLSKADDELTLAKKTLLG